MTSERIRLPGLRWGIVAVRILTASSLYWTLHTVADLLIDSVSPGAMPSGAATLAIFGALFAGRGATIFHLRRIVGVLGQGCVLAVSIFLALGSYPGLPLGELSSVTDQVAALLIAIVVASYWFAGFHVARRPVTYVGTVNVFDASFGALLFVAFVRIGFGLYDPVFPRAAVLSVGCGVFALIAARHLDTDRLAVRHRSLSGSVIVGGTALAIAAAATYVAYPLLTRGATALYGVMRDGAVAAGPWLVRALQALFGVYSGGSGGGGAVILPGEVAETIAPTEAGPLMRLILKVVSWGFAGFIVVVVAALLVWRVVVLTRYLLKRPKTGPRDFSWTAAWEALRCAFRRLAGTVQSRFGRSERRELTIPGRAFRRLQSWGRFSGYRRERWETPAEYGERLTNRFPDYRETITVIVGAANVAFYRGDSVPVGPETTRPRAETVRPGPAVEARAVARAMKKLGPPAMFPIRGGAVAIATIVRQWWPGSHRDPV